MRNLYYTVRYGINWMFVFILFCTAVAGILIVSPFALIMR